MSLKTQRAQGRALASHSSFADSSPHLAGQLTIGDPREQPTRDRLMRDHPPFRRRPERRPCTPLPQCRS